MLKQEKFTVYKRQSMGEDFPAISWRMQKAEQSLKGIAISLAKRALVAFKLIGIGPPKIYIIQSDFD